jgi:fermentation-respiration switch protein FrsA (DUF1100 family)
VNNFSTSTWTSHIAFRWIVRATGFYLGALVLLIFFERFLVFPAPSPELGNWQVESFGAKEFYVDSQEQTRVHVWTFPKNSAKTTLIFCHGNAEFLGRIGREMSAIRDRWNVNVVAFDYRGYGRTGGVPNEKRTLADAIAVGNWVKSNPDFQNQKLVVLGRSLGGAHAVEIATQLQTDGLMLDRTFSSTVDVAASRYFFFPVHWVMANQFKSIDKIPSFKGALLQLHGLVDEVIPYRFGKQLFEACTSEDKKLMTLPKLYHTQPLPPEFWEAGFTFMRAIESK